MNSVPPSPGKGSSSEMATIIPEYPLSCKVMLVDSVTDKLITSSVTNSAEKAIVRDTISIGAKPIYSTVTNFTTWTNGVLSLTFGENEYNRAERLNEGYLFTCWRSRASFRRSICLVCTVHGTQAQQEISCVYTHPLTRR